MQKDDRRNHYQKKQRHTRKDKDEYNQKKELGQNIIQKEFHSIGQLANFLENDYDKIILKTPEHLPKINKQAVKALHSIRDQWIKTQKDNCIQFMNANGVADAQKVYQQVIGTKHYLYKGEYRITISTIQAIPYLNIVIPDRNNPNSKPKEKQFCIGSLLNQLDFQVENKRVKKDVLYYCDIFQKITKEARKITSL